MKRTNQKKLGLGLTLLGTLCYFGADLNVKDPQGEITAPAITHQTTTPVTPQVSLITPPVIFKEPKVKANREYVKEPAPARGLSGIKMGKVLPEGYKLAKDIFALKASEYSPVLGSKLEERNGLIFFRSEQRPSNAIHVAVDENNQKIYPISSVLKIRNIDENLRLELLASGLNEHYYQESLKVLYVKSTQDELLSVLEDLQKQELEVAMEVMRATHQAR